MRILALTRYGMSGPSSRVRFFQYFDGLRDAGFDVVQTSLFSDAYVAGLFSGNKHSGRIVYGLIRRMLRLVTEGPRSRVLWIEKDLLPWLPFIFERRLLPAGVPIVMDIDDAIFHQYELSKSKIARRLLQNKFRQMASTIDVAVAGSHYLASSLREYGYENVSVIPSVVDTDRYRQVDQSSRPPKERIVIGWIGSPVTAPYLHLIGDALREIVSLRKVEIVAVGARSDQIHGLPIKCLPWSESHEPHLVSEFDIGIMPLPDQPFERGKCAYKIVQYLAAGIPVVASPVGENQLILEQLGASLPRSEEEWCLALLTLIDDASLRAVQGKRGRMLAESNYSIRSSLPKMVNIFSSLVEQRA